MEKKNKRLESQALQQIQKLQKLEEEKKRIESQAREQIQKLQDERQKTQTEKKAQLAKVVEQMSHIMRRLHPSNAEDCREFRRMEPILEVFVSLFPEAFMKKYTARFCGRSTHYPLVFLCAVESKESLREHVLDLLPEAASAAFHVLLSCDCISVTLPMMKWLLTKQPDMASKSDRSGYLLLHHACDQGKDLQVIKLLVEANPESVNTRTKRHEIPMQLALAHSGIEVIRYLMERQDPKPTEYFFLKDGGIPLQHLLDNKNLDIMKYVFEMLPSLLTAQVRHYGSPLHYVFTSLSYL